MENIDIMDDFKLEYEPAWVANLLKNQKNKIKKGRVKTMENKETKKLNIETIKTVVIAVLVTGIIAFIAGIKYQQNKQAELERKIDESISTSKQAQ